MGASNAVHSYGTTLTIAGNAIAEITNISAAGKSLNLIDVTHLNSDDKYHEFVGGLRDGKEMTIEGNFYPGDTNGQVVLNSSIDNATLQAFVLTFPAAMATTITFNGYVTDLETGAPLDDKVPFSATIKPSGKPDINITLSTGMSGWAGIEENAGAALTEVPGFAIGTYGIENPYVCVVNTASTYVKMTPTAAGHTITIHNYFDDSEQEVASGAQSGELDLDAADSTTIIDITVQETGKVAKVYRFVIQRP